MSFSRTEFERVLKKLSVLPDGDRQRRGGFVIDTAGRLMFPPVYINRSQEFLSAEVEERIRISLLICREDFQRLKACTMSREEYLATRER